MQAMNCIIVLISLLSVLLPTQAILQDLFFQIPRTLFLPAYPIALKNCSGNTISLLLQETRTVILTLPVSIFSYFLINELMESSLLSSILKMSRKQLHVRTSFVIWTFLLSMQTVLPILLASIPLQKQIKDRSVIWLPGIF